MSGWDGEDLKIQVETIGFLANNLRGYEPKSILREQLQNADDASHVQGRRGELCLEFLHDRLIVTNPSLFSSEDWRRLTRPSSRGKFADAEQTGEFGIGFWGSLHLTDAPIVTSGIDEVTLHPDSPTRREVSHLDGTRIEFRYRRTHTELSRQLDANVITPEVEKDMATTFVAQMAELLLFTRAIDTIRIVLPDGRTRTAARSIEPISDGIARLTIAIDGAPEENGRYLTVRSTVENPPKGRHDRVTAALPLSDRHRGPGRAFFMFPTETESGIGFNIDAHFRATDDRRSLENTGEHGAWNDRIFEAAGRAVGEALETILRPDVHGLSVEDAFGWFAISGSQLQDVARRTRIVASALDQVAIRRRVIPDRQMRYRRGDELVDLPPEVEPIIGKAVGESAMPTRSASTRTLFRRWGLKQWGPADVARWLREQLPHVRVERKDTAAFMRDNDGALALLQYCKGQPQLLRGVAVVLGTDDAFHPLGGELARPSQGLAHLVEGLGRPLVHHSYLGSWVSSAQPETTPDWFRAALLRAADQLVGERVPVRSVACAAKQQHVSESIEVIRRAKGGLDGVPLAMDENGRLERFDSLTVVGLTESGRKNSEALVRRLGLRPLHSKIDDESVKSVGLRFSAQLVADSISSVTDWDPIVDSRLLVEVLASVAREGDTPGSIVESFRSRRMWSGTDGEIHTLAELRLPERDRLRRPSFPLVDATLLGEVSPSAPVYATFKGLLRVDVLDSTEETVLECESPSREPAALRELLSELAFHRELSKSQKERLRAAPFVLCRDGQVRVPAEVVLTLEQLPLGLGDRCIDVEAGSEKRVRELLASLGANWVPLPEDMVDCAAEIAGLPVQSDWSHEPGRLLWSFLLDFHDQYSTGTMGALAEISWLVSIPGSTRQKPRRCLDPQLSFASLLFPVPAGEQPGRPAATPPQAFRDALKIRASLETDECVELGRAAAAQASRLSNQYFLYLNTRCRRSPQDAASIARLRSIDLIPLPAGSFVSPDRLVSRQRYALWGHLRAVVPDEFVAQYPALLEAWGITADEEVTWQDHVDVLEELLRGTEADRHDVDLAVSRLKDLGEFELGEHQLKTVYTRSAVPTSLGLQRMSESFRNDLPPDIADRLGRHLPIVEDSSDVVDLLDRLPLRRLSATVSLDPLVEGEQRDQVWQPRLVVHAPNVMRFLKDAGTRLDLDILTAWPPQVVSVSSLVIRASINGAPLDEWPAAAHLTNIDGESVLYVNGMLNDPHAIVDAVSSAYGIDRGRKSTLLRVLEFTTAAEGARHLDWDGIPALTDIEASHFGVPVELEIVLDDEPEALPETPRERQPPAQPPSNSGREAVAATEQPPAPAESSNGAVDASREETDVIIGQTPSDSSPAEASSARDLGRPSSPRGLTDREALEDAGITIVRDLEQDTLIEDYEPKASDPDDTRQTDEHRSVLSFVDVSKGLVPVPRSRLRWLTSETALREVLLFGEVIAASEFDDSRIQISNGAALFQDRLVVPGTVVRLHPSLPGRVEVEIRAHQHHLDGVWMLEIAEDGRLSRIVQDDIELQWETDDAFYRAERRLEDIEALMADVGKSAVQLVIEVFIARSEEGLTTDEVWGLVAISRLFAIATIDRILRTQTGLFAKTNGLWYKVGNEMRTARPSGTGGRVTSPVAGAGRPAAHAEALKIARKLAQLLQTVDEPTVRQVAQLLGLRDLLDDADFADACRRFLGSGEPALLTAIERQIAADQQLASLAIDQLATADVETLRARRGLLDVVIARGSASAVVRGSELRSVLDDLEGDGSSDPVSAARSTLRAATEGSATKAQLTKRLEAMWAHSLGDPLVMASLWLRGLSEMEQIHRAAAQVVDDIERVGKARRRQLGALHAQMTAEVYDTPESQQLRVVLDLLRGASASTVLDGLHQLALLADKTPGSEGDAAVLYALVCAEADRSQSKWVSIVTKSQQRIADLPAAQPSVDTSIFVAEWMALVRLPRGDLERHLKRG